MPKPSEKVVGGHAVMAVGYDDSKSVVIVRNSWAASWGDKGYFYMPYAYVTSNNLCDDFWDDKIGIVLIGMTEEQLQIKNRGHCFYQA